MIEVPTWFGPADARLFGWFCLPESETSTLSVLLCPPIGEEEHNAHETFRRLAATLADRGMASLRFDYHGTGDSAGRWNDTERAGAWSTSIQRAHEALRALGTARVAAVGMRIGATLAATAVLQRDIDVRALVMWDPCSGKSMLREGRARCPSTLPPPPGSVDTPGYLYPPQTVADLHGLDPVALPGERLPCHTLVLTRDDRPTPRKLRERLEGPHVEWDDAPGQGDLLDLPMTHNVVPTATVHRVAQWLADRAAIPVPAVLPTTRDATFRATPAAPPVAEHIVSLGDRGLFGIVTEPPQVTREPLVVLVNVASDRHVGPGRRWVELARDWASRGFRVLRMDQSGTGDSPCRDGQAFGVLYAREWLEDLPDALRSPPCLGKKLALVSLCSGAYSSMEAAFCVPVDAVYAINVILHAKVTSKASPLFDERRQAARPPISPLLRLSDRYPRGAALLWRGYRQITVWNAPAASVAALLGRGTDVILLMSVDDGRHFTETVYWSILRSRRARRAGRYRRLVGRRVDHTLMTQEGQRWVVDALTTDLVTRYPEWSPTAPTRRRVDEGVPVA